MIEPNALSFCISFFQRLIRNFQAFPSLVPLFRVLMCFCSLLQDVDFINVDVTANATFFYGLKSQRINPTPPRETRVVPQDTEIQKERTTEEGKFAYSQESMLRRCSFSWEYHSSTITLQS